MAVISDSASATLAGKRVSWGAVFAGVFIAIGVHILLGLLGIAIGATSIDPLSEANPVAGIGMGAGIYVVVSSLLALFAGGYAAGAMAIVQDRRDRTLHGLTTWAVATVLMFMLLTTAVGRIVGGTASLVAGGLSKAGGAAASLAQPVADQLGQQVQQMDLDIDLSALRQEARQLLRQTGASELQPAQLEQDAARLGEQASTAATRIARDPQAADEEIQRLFDRFQAEARETLSAADRDALANVLTTRTDMDGAEARRTVQKWEQGYQQARQQAQQEWEQLQQQAGQKAREWGEAAADATAKAAWWTFFVVLLSAIAAAVGANVGANRPIVTARESVLR